MLAPGGRVIFIVPNRSGLWARRDVTPFGHGRPYSFGQLETLLGKHRLAAERHAAALYAPPSHRRFWVQAAYFWERVGRRFDPQVVAGALLVEATKRLYARPPSSGSKVAVPGPLDVLEGLAGPKPEPVGGHGRSAVASPTGGSSGRPPRRGRGASSFSLNVLPRSRGSAITAPISMGTGGAVPRYDRNRSRRGRVRATERCQCPAQLH